MLLNIFLLRILFAEFAELSRSLSSYSWVYWAGWDTLKFHSVDGTNHGFVNT